MLKNYKKTIKSFVLVCSSTIALFFLPVVMSLGNIFQRGGSESLVGDLLSDPVKPAHADIPFGDGSCVGCGGIDSGGGDQGDGACSGSCSSGGESAF